MCRAVDDDDFGDDIDVDEKYAHFDMYCCSLLRRDMRGASGATNLSWQELVVIVVVHVPTCWVQNNDNDVVDLDDTDTASILGDVVTVVALDR